MWRARGRTSTRAYVSALIVWAVVALAAAAASDPLESEDPETPAFLWAVAPGVSHTSSLGWTASAGLFVGRRVGTPSEGYASGIGALLAMERSSRGRRYAAGAHLVVKPDHLPLVGTLGAGVNVAYLELCDVVGRPRVRLVGPEIQVAFVLRFRVGYMFQTTPSSGANRSGVTWSVGVGF